MAAMVELVLPLAITVLAAQNAQGFAVLEAAGHKPPVNVVTGVCGFVSLLTAPFGTVPTCFTGPANALLVSSGTKETHYAAGVLMSVMAILFGLFSPAFTTVMLATPTVFVTTIAGLAFLRVLERAFVVSFGGTFTFGAAVAFLVTVANVPIFSIGAPFWALLAGFAVSWLLERKDFEKLAGGSRAVKTSVGRTARRRASSRRSRPSADVEARQMASHHTKTADRSALARSAMSKLARKNR